MPTVRERDGKFQSIVRVKQHGVLVHQEAKTFATEKLARDWGKRLEDKLKKDGVPARLRAQITLGELITKYADARDEVKPLRRAMRHELDQLSGELGTLKLESLSPETFTSFARRRRQEGAGPTTVLHNLASIRSILNAAKPMFGFDVDGDAVSTAIAALTRTGHVGKSTHRDRRASSAELDLLIAEFIRIAPHPSTIIPMSLIVSVAVELPRRLGELCSMLWSDYLGGVVLLRDTKHPLKPRTERIPVPPAAQRLIETLPRIDERMLPYKSESISASFQRACERCQIRDLHFHDLRHEGISRLFEKGLSIQEVALISGHQSWNMLRRYTHIQPEAVLEKLGAGQ
jgi:integrase